MPVFIDDSTHFHFPTFSQIAPILGKQYQMAVSDLEIGPAVKNERAIPHFSVFASLKKQPKQFQSLHLVEHRNASLFPVWIRTHRSARILATPAYAPCPTFRNKPKNPFATPPCPGAKNVEPKRQDFFWSISLNGPEKLRCVCRGTPDQKHVAERREDVRRERLPIHQTRDSPHRVSNFRQGNLPPLPATFLRRPNLRRPGLCGACKSPPRINREWRREIHRFGSQPASATISAPST
jgi:hypothetical protein